MFAKAIIRRARFIPSGDPLAARARLERVLGAADWSVPGLPPGAILCARRLRARVSTPGVIPAALEALARVAARPAREFVPAAAEAVWFADTAEWLACHARDALAGEPASRWWWEVVSRDAAPVRAAAREWLAAPAAAPAAWGLLADWGVARPFAAALEPGEAAALTRGVCVAFGIRPNLATGFAPAGVVRLVPQASELPPGPGRATLALGLLLARSPHLARDGASVAHLLAWAELGAGPTAAPGMPGEPTTPRATRIEPQAGSGSRPRSDRTASERCPSLLLHPRPDKRYCRSNRMRIERPNERIRPHATIVLPGG